VQGVYIRLATVESISCITCYRLCVRSCVNIYVTIR